MAFRSRFRRRGLSRRRPVVRRRGYYRRKSVVGRSRRRSSLRPLRIGHRM